MQWHCYGASWCRGVGGGGLEKRDIRPIVIQCRTELIN